MAHSIPAALRAAAIEASVYLDPAQRYQPEKRYAQLNGLSFRLFDLHRRILDQMVALEDTGKLKED